MEIELMFLETSAATGENVEEAFLKCSRSILTKIDAGNINVTIVPLDSAISYLCTLSNFGMF